MNLKKLFESPDHLILKNPKTGDEDYINYDEEIARPFAFKPVLDDNDDVVHDEDGHPILTELWVGDWGQSHSYDCPFVEEVGYENLQYKGRLWFNVYGGEPEELNVISFWDKLDKSELEKVVKDISKEIETDLSDWYLDLGRTGYVDCEKCNGTGKGEDDDGHDYCIYCEGEGIFDSEITKLIPLKEYEGGLDLGTSEEEKAIHLMSWEEKQALKKRTGWGRGWGSDMTAWGGKNPLQWRQAKYQENLIIKFEDFKKWKLS